MVSHSVLDRHDVFLPLRVAIIILMAKNYLMLQLVQRGRKLLVELLVIGIGKFLNGLVGSCNTLLVDNLLNISRINERGEGFKFSIIYCLYNCLDD